MPEYKVLMVAEKPSIASSIAQALSKGKVIKISVYQLSLNIFKSIQQRKASQLQF